jgi:hypothetical protein
MAPKRQPARKPKAQEPKPNAQAIRARRIEQMTAVYDFLAKAGKWVLIAIVVPLAVGIMVWFVEWWTERPAVGISTGTPPVDDLVFYQAVLEDGPTYTNDDWNIRIERLAPFSDTNPIFGMSDLPPLQVPITVTNDGRKATTLTQFHLTIYGSPALISSDGYIVDKTGNLAPQQTVFVDVGQEQSVIVRFPMMRLEPNLPAPKVRGMTFGNPILFQRTIRLDVRDISDRSSSALIQYTRLQLDPTHHWFAWTTIRADNRGAKVMTSHMDPLSGVLLDRNPHIIKAFVKAGAAYVEHDCLECAFKYLNYALAQDGSQAEGYYYRGVAYHRQGQLDNAKKDFATCVSLSRDVRCKQELLDLDKGVQQ